MLDPLDTSSTTYSVADFLGWQRQQQLNLRPVYQRRSVWTKRSKSLLIDSLLRGYPLPQIFLHNSLDLDRATSIRQVVDGQQRIRTLLAFVEPDSLPDFAETDDFTILRSHNKDFFGLTFEEFPSAAKAQILETRLSTVILPSGIPDVEVLRIFQRMNSTGLKLNYQEMRNAEYFGEFKDLSYSLAYLQNQRWLNWGLFTPQKIAQMLEVEFTSDLLGLILLGVRARTKGSIDKLYRDNDEQLHDADQLAATFEWGCDQLDAVFGIGRPPSSLKRFRTPAWVYACFAVLTNVDRVGLNDEVSGQDAGFLEPSPEELVEALQEADLILRSGHLGEDTAKVLRGATADRVSRVQRISFLRDCLG